MCGLYLHLSGLYVYGSHSAAVLKTRCMLSSLRCQTHPLRLFFLIVVIGQTVSTHWAA
jgi:hypothetical protein